LGKKSNIEDVFKDAFQSFEAPVDPSVWAGVQSGMSAGSAGAGAAGTSLAAKIIGITVAAAVTTGIVIGVYQATSSDENPKQEETQKELVEEVNTPKEKEETIQPLIVEEITTVPVEDQPNHDENKVPETPIEPPKKDESKPNSGSKEDLSGEAKDVSDDPNLSNDGSETQSDKDKENLTSKDDGVNSTKDDKKPAVDPLDITAQIENSKGKAPLTVKMIGKTNGNDLLWTVNDGKDKHILAGNDQEFTFEKSGKYLVVVEGTNETGEVEKQEFLVEVEADIQISLTLEPSLLGRDKGVILTPNGYDNKHLKFEIENEDQFEFFKMVVVDGNTQKVVFETNDISQRNWNGKNQAGEPLPAGQSYYLTVFAGDKNGNTVDPIRKRLSIIR
jgi:hypothetical protein